MVAALRAVASLLAGEPLTVDQVIDHLGAVTRDYGGNVLLAPREPGFRQASVVRAVDPSTGSPTPTPAYVALTPLAPPPLTALTDAFGPFRRVPATGSIPERAMFALPTPGSPSAVTLIAEVEQGRATRITLRRDPRP